MKKPSKKELNKRDELLYDLRKDYLKHISTLLSNNILPWKTPDEYQASINGLALFNKNNHNLMIMINSFYDYPLNRIYITCAIYGEFIKKYPKERGFNGLIQKTFDWDDIWYNEENRLYIKGFENFGFLDEYIC